MPSAAASDTVETNPTSPVSPLAPYPSLPTEARSRAPEFYGFVAWSGTYLLFCIFLLWALLPDEYIVSLGVSWYPNRYVKSSPFVLHGTVHKNPPSLSPLMFLQAH